MNKIFTFKREIFKNNNVVPEETIISENFFLTEEDAVKAMLKEMDKCMLYYKYKTCTEAFTLIDEKLVHNKQVTYRNEWTVVTLQTNKISILSSPENIW